MLTGRSFVPFENEPQRVCKAAVREYWAAFTRNVFHMYTAWSCMAISTIMLRRCVTTVFELDPCIHT